MAILSVLVAIHLALYRVDADQAGLASGVDLAYRLPRTFLVGRGGTVLDERQGSQTWTDPAVVEAVKARLTAARGPTR